jgi:hypothetical protein
MNVDIQPPSDDPGDPNESSERVDMQQHPSPPGSSNIDALARFLEDIYGALFTPAQTFASLRSHPPIVSSICTIVLVNCLESIRTGKKPLQIVLAIVTALIGWLIFALLLQRLATVFHRQVEINVLLCLTAFGSLPWIFIGPALSLGGEFGTTMALFVLLWFTIWQVWAASVAIGISIWQLALLVPLAIAGGFTAIIWTSNAIGLLVSIANP